MAIVQVIISAVLTCMGSIGLVLEVRELIRALASRRWIVGEAIISSASVRQRRGSKGRMRFEPLVEMRYRHEGREYVGNRIAFGTLETGDRIDAERVAARFTPGTSWVVHVCPTHPELAVLEAGPTEALWFRLSFLCVFTLAAGIFLVVALREVMSSSG